MQNQFRCVTGSLRETTTRRNVCFNSFSFLSFYLPFFHPFFRDFRIKLIANRGRRLLHRHVSNWSFEFKRSPPHTPGSSRDDRGDLRDRARKLYKSEQRACVVLIGPIFDSAREPLPSFSYRIDPRFAVCLGGRFQLVLPLILPPV